MGRDNGPFLSAAMNPFFCGYESLTLYFDHKTRCFYRRLLLEERPAETARVVGRNGRAHARECVSARARVHGPLDCFNHNPEPQYARKYPRQNTKLAIV